MDMYLLEADISNTNVKSNKKKYKCPYCEARIERAKLYLHIQDEHEDLIPEGYTALRVAFNSVNNKTCGHCIICKKETDWNETKGRYERLCNNPGCHEAYKRIVAERNQRIYGTDRLQSDPRYADFVQRKALEGRKMFGKYKFADGGEIAYLGSYERKLLVFLNDVMECKSEDILAPGPSIVYKYEGVEHTYIPDFYYIPYNLIIEVKDGGTNPNTHPKRMGADRERIHAKEQAVIDERKFNYVRVTNNNFGQLMSVMAALKFSYYYTSIPEEDYIVRANESAMLESVLFNEKDIYYNKDKFDSGEINLCFITGLSGSGKSTMGRDMQKSGVEHYELDDLMCVSDHFTMDQLKEYGDLIYSFFNGVGKKFYPIKKADLKDIPGEEYEDKLYPAFVNYAKTYAKSHKSKKFIIEGVQLFGHRDGGNALFTPSDFDDYAFYIKGTSMIISKIRAAKRDAQDSEHKNATAVRHFMTHNWKWYFIDEKDIKKFRDYFSKKMKSVNESITLPNTIDTIVLDFGGVLVETAKGVEDQAWAWAADHGLTKDQMYQLIMKYYEAVQYNEQYTTAQAKARFKKIVSPEYRDFCDDIFSFMENGKVLCDYTHKLLSSLKSKGYKLYYLSNIHKAAYEGRKASGLMDFADKYFEGGVFSFETKYRKPDPKLYQILIDKYNIDPSTSVFIDDKKENIATAESLGFFGILFDRVGKTTVKDLMKFKPVRHNLFEDMSGTIAAALAPNPIPHEADKDNYYIVQHPQNNVFAYGITKDPGQSIIYSVDPEEKGFYKAFKTKKGDIEKKYLTFKIKDSQTARELYDELALMEKTGAKVFDESVTSSEFIYRRLTEGSEILSPEQLLFDTRFELVKNPETELQEMCDNLYKWLKARPIDVLEEQVALLEDYYTDGLTDYNVLPDNIDNLEDLKKWKNRYDSMPFETRMRSDDISLDLYKDTNMNRYTKKMAGLLDIVDPQKNNPIENLNKNTVMVSDLFRESAIDSEAAKPDVLNSYEWEAKMEKTKEAEDQGLIIMVHDGRACINDESDLAAFKEKWNRYQSLPEDKRILSSQTASNIFGLNNENLYTKILNDYINREEFFKNAGGLGKYLYDEDPGSDVSQYFNPGEEADYVSSDATVQNESASEREKEKKFEQRMESLENLSMRLRNTTNEVKRKILKQQIKARGWNPEIPYNKEAVKRVNEFKFASYADVEEVEASTLCEAIAAMEDIPKERTSESLKDKIVPVFVILSHGTQLHSKGIMWFTDSEWSHASLALDSSLKEMYTFTTNIDNAPNKRHRNGFAIDTVERYMKYDPHMKVKVYALFITPKQREEMRDAIQWYIRHQDDTSYGFKNIMNIFARRMTRRKAKDGDKCKMVCSQFVYTILMLVNFRLRKNKDSSLVSPADIDDLSDDARFYVVYQGGIDEYDSKKVDKICYDLLPSLPVEMYGIQEGEGTKMVVTPKSAIGKPNMVNRVLGMADEMLR